VQLSRPTTLAEMRRRIDLMATPEGVRRGLAYRPGPTDVFISPYAKCGTTWMQQIVHGLRTGGDMAFDEITEAVPWLELAQDMGIDIEAPQAARPHAFKSHLTWDEIPKGGRYIIVFRDPVDAMVSLYRFFEGWFFETGSISMDEFATNYQARQPGYWGHARSWWRQRGRPDVLLLAYENMKRDLAGTAERVADFIDPGIGRAARDIAARQAGFEFMKAHARQFDDHLIRTACDAVCGLPPDGQATKVDRGEAGQGVALVTPEIRAAFDARWRETLGAEYGLASYDDLRRQLEN